MPEIERIGDQAEKHHWAQTQKRAYPRSKCAFGMDHKRATEYRRQGGKSRKRCLLVVEEHGHEHEHEAEERKRFGSCLRLDPWRKAHGKHGADKQLPAARREVIERAFRPVLHQDRGA